MKNTKIQVHHADFRATYRKKGEAQEFELRQKKQLVVSGRLDSTESHLAVGPRALPEFLRALDWFIYRLNALLEPVPQAKQLRDRNE